MATKNWSARWMDSLPYRCRSFFLQDISMVKFSDLWCVLGVLILGIAWEVFEWIIENYKPYITKEKWAYNTMADIVVETGIAWWMVL